ncbi:hypothetical protein MJT46_006384 [Ovis ammon polii x Ovis aries]|uniref:Uncharacterized protein n=1 Tax=Ovis aries TaxID=9940 RepID=A0A836D316_SHEEP|nr:hypothetical protein JEQ12_015953 [Ovis aries]KAI4570867.1 hypothetical protein MJT46_006384 [Ovis ammon polii x Ovis aries]
MASLYQRFTGKINTSRSFPAPPEASRLLGGQGPEEDGAGPKPLGAQAPAAAPRERGGGGGAGGRPRFQYQARSDCDDEDIHPDHTDSPFPRVLNSLQNIAPGGDPAPGLRPWCEDRLPTECQGAESLSDVGSSPCELADLSELIRRKSSIELGEI